MWTLTFFFSFSKMACFCNYPQKHLRNTFFPIYFPIYPEPIYFFSCLFLTFGCWQTFIVLSQRGRIPLKSWGRPLLTRSRAHFMNRGTSYNMTRQSEAIAGYLLILLAQNKLHVIAEKHLFSPQRCAVCTLYTAELLHYRVNCILKWPHNTKIPTIRFGCRDLFYCQV